jgi:oxygen-independent coproporphyrinogen-3 oxidase
MLWEGSDLVALGVASFGHLSGIHYQNAPHWDDYLSAVEGETLPVTRGVVPTRRELLIREMVLCLKRGWLDTDRLKAKFGIDPLQEWAADWECLRSDGFLEPVEGQLRLTRKGLLRVDSLLHRFFDGQ